MDVMDSLDRSDVKQCLDSIRFLGVMYSGCDGPFRCACTRLDMIHCIAVKDCLDNSNV